jgi:hypothetical protein
MRARRAPGLIEDAKEVLFQLPMPVAGHLVTSEGIYICIWHQSTV